MSSPITTHVLDTATGKPARGMTVVLERLDGGAWVQLGHGATDADGRHRNLMNPADRTDGIFRLTFATGEWFRATGVSGFYPAVQVVFEITDPEAHHHVPLLISPYGYSTYRGS